MADPRVLLNESETGFRSPHNFGGACLPHRLARPLELGHVLLLIAQGDGRLKFQKTGV